MRIQFKKGKQKKFIKKVLKNLNCPTLKAFEQFGFEIPYSTMKNYSAEERTLPKEFFEELCSISKINQDKLSFEIIEDNFGQIKGGKKSKRITHS